MAMSRTEIADKLKDIMSVAFGTDAQQLDSYTEASRLVEDLGLNSVGILYVVIGIEEVFSVRFGDIGASEFKTVGDVIDYIEKMIA